LVLGVDIIGFGAIGRELARRIATDEDLKSSFSVASITDSGGAIYPRSQADVLKSIELKSAGKSLSSAGLSDKKSGKGSQIAVDVTTSDYKKPEDAKKRATEVLDSGRHLVSANKVALAYYFSEILGLAKKKRLAVGYGATICGGVNAISVAKRMAPGEIISAGAVLNASTTMILSMLEDDQSLSLDEASRRASETGVLEKDWSIDLDGIDAGAKSAILANVLFPGQSYSLADVAIRGIRDEKAQAVINYISQKKKQSGEKVRLISEISKDSISVEPRTVSNDSPLAVPGRFNAVLLNTKTLGEISIRNFGGGVELTASVIVSDLKSIQRLSEKKKI
jgi:homoserine dehydrogenase